MVSTAYPTIGLMPMPANFKYTDVLRRGRPHHEKWDSFSLRHPPMSATHWAKIFSPFDALEGFDERIAEKEVLYESRIELCDDDQAELDRRLNIPTQSHLEHPHGKSQPCNGQCKILRPLCG